MVKLTVKNLDEAIKKLDPVQFKMAQRSALSVTARGTNKLMLKEITSVYNLKRKQAEAFVPKPDIHSSGTRAKALFKASNKKIPVIEFGATWSRTNQAKKYKIMQTGEGARVSIIRGTRKTIPHTFIATMPGGHKGVFERKVSGGKRVGRFPIQEIMGPSVYDLLRGQKIMNKIRQYVPDRLRTVLASTIKFRMLKKYGVGLEYENE